MPKIKEINLSTVFIISDGNPVIDEHWLCECKMIDIDKLSLGYAKYTCHYPATSV
jgi:hypothetical protein